MNEVNFIQVARRKILKSIDYINKVQDDTEKQMANVKEIEDIKKDLQELKVYNATYEQYDAKYDEIAERIGFYYGQDHNILDNPVILGKIRSIQLHNQWATYSIKDKLQTLIQLDPPEIAQLNVTPKLSELVRDVMKLKSIYAKMADTQRMIKATLFALKNDDPVVVTYLKNINKLETLRSDLHEVEATIEKKKNNATPILAELHSLISPGSALMMMDTNAHLANSLPGIHITANDLGRHIMSLNDDGNLGIDFVYMMYGDNIDILTLPTVRYVDESVDYYRASAGAKSKTRRRKNAK
jgi:hypothetical protein